MKFSDVLYGYVPHSDERRAEIWMSAHFCLDANVLLNLYRYSDSNMTQFVSLLRAIKDRLFVPHRVALEFARNRAAVIRAQPDPHRQISEGLKVLADRLAAQFAKHPDLEKLTQILTHAKQHVDEKFTSTTDRQAKLLRDDQILRELLDTIQGEVGAPYAPDELSKEYERRKKEGVPPYRKTDDKEKDAEEAQGDLAVWLELMARYRDSELPLIFVTDDAKSNWWQKSGGHNDPHPALVREMRDNTKSDILFYGSQRFIEHAKLYVKPGLSDALAEETKEIHRRVAEAVDGAGRLTEGYEQLLGLSLPAATDLESHLILKFNEAREQVRKYLDRTASLKHEIERQRDRFVRATDSAEKDQANAYRSNLEARLGKFEERLAGYSIESGRIHKKLKWLQAHRSGLDSSGQ